MTDTTPETDPQEVGQQISDLLAALSQHDDPSVGEAAEDMARLLMGMYGAGLERILALLAGAGPSDDGNTLVARLVDDDMIAGLLVLHDLHPEDTDARVARALASVRPYLGSHAGDVELLGVAAEPDGPVVKLALRGSCDGCPSSAVTVTTAIEKAIEELCPEVVRVDVEGMAEPAAPAKDKELPLLQIGTRPSEPETAVAETPVAWVVLDPPTLRPGQCAQLEVASTAVLLALPSGAPAPDAGGLVAYRDQCPSCHRSLDGATLVGEELTCAGCGVAFDIRHAGRALDGSSRHLEPLPLVRRAGGWRLAVPRPLAGATS